MNLLATELRAFVLCDLVQEGLGQVGCIVVGRAACDVDPAVLLLGILEQLPDQLNGLRSGRDDLLDSVYSWVLESERELDLVVGVVDVLERAELVEPGAVELLASVPLGLGPWDALDDGSVGERDFK